MTKPIPDDLNSYMRGEEGRRLHAFDDKTGQPVEAGGKVEGNLTIGEGHTGPDVEPGLVWTEAQVDAAKERDLAKAAGEAGQIIGADVWQRLCQPRRSAIISLVYQLGAHGFGDFTQTIDAIRAYNWPEAARVLMLSKDGTRPSHYAREVPKRAARTAYMLKTGAWPTGDLWA